MVGIMDSDYEELLRGAGYSVSGDGNIIPGYLKDDVIVLEEVMDDGNGLYCTDKDGFMPIKSYENQGWWPFSYDEWTNDTGMDIWAFSLERADIYFLDPFVHYLSDGYLAWWYAEDGNAPAGSGYLDRNF